MQSSDLLLSIQHLSVGFKNHSGKITQVVKDLSLELSPGEMSGIVGESGSGKTLSMLTLLGLLPTGAEVSGNIFLYTSGAPVNLSGMSEEDFRRIRGRSVSMIFQEPMTSLNPVMRVGEQVNEMIRQHLSCSEAEAKKNVLQWFREVKLPDPEKTYGKYPFELSGGQKQRVMIALAMCCNPVLIVADEPTTALDVTVQKTVMDLLRDLCLRHRTGLILISHDLALVSQYCRNIYVMRKGICVESGSAHSICHHPVHPYTNALLQCRPSAAYRGQRLPVISDFIPDENTPVYEILAAGHVADDFAVMAVANLKVFYPRTGALGSSLHSVPAIQGVNFVLNAGKTLAIVGESGSGKTSLVKALVRWLPFTGTYLYKGRPVLSGAKAEPGIQMVFQDPYSALNPSMRCGNAIAEAASVSGNAKSKKEAAALAASLLQKVGLDESAINKYPHQLSGGQRQRIVIARALACNPSVLICDESVAALDVSVQSQVLNLLRSLQESLGFAMIFVTHDLHIAEYLSDEVLVLSSGKVVEQGSTEKIFSNPASDYTRSLLEAMPSFGK